MPGQVLMGGWQIGQSWYRVNAGKLVQSYKTHMSHRATRLSRVTRVTRVSRLPPTTKE